MKFCPAINLPWGHVRDVRSRTKFWPVGLFSRFDQPFLEWYMSFSQRYEVSMFLILKTEYFQLGFLYKCDLHISNAATQDYYVVLSLIR